MICFSEGATSARVRVSQNREIAARDIEADAGKRYLLLVSDNAANRLRVTFVSIGAKHAAFATGCDAGLDLFNRGGVVLAENFDR